MKKRIFLDIDGVLNWERSISHYKWYLGIDTKRLRLLAHIVEETGAEIVLISTWGRDFVVGAYKQEDGSQAKYLNNKLRSQGLKVYDKIAFSRYYHKYDRPYAIAEYLELHNPDTYVIIDDEWFLGYDRPEIEEHLICCCDNFRNMDEYSGLTPYLAEKAIEILNGVAKGPVIDENISRICKE